MNDQWKTASADYLAGRRCVKLYSNPGELVLDPFTGIGTVPYVAIELGRPAVRFELKESYHRTAVKNVSKILNSSQQEQLPMLALRGVEVD